MESLALLWLLVRIVISVILLIFVLHFLFVVPHHLEDICKELRLIRKSLVKDDEDFEDDLENYT